MVAWMQLGIGVLILLSPWALSTGEGPMLWVNTGLGGATILLALWDIVIGRSGKNQQP